VVRLHTRSLAGNPTGGRAPAAGYRGPVMLQRLDLRGRTDLAGLLPRPELDSHEPVAAVRTIIDDVRVRGDAALADYTERFDGVVPDHLAVPPEELARALDVLGAEAPEVVEALRAAAGAITAFHETQLVAPHTHERDGVIIESWRQPVGRAGCYVPGGRAAYPSTVLMCALPARVAGVDRVVLCVPPGPDGRIAPVTLAAAALAGVDEVYAVGGAQAIAAMAHGTATIAAVDTISGPGNVYVAIAKREVAGIVGVPSAFAGPSEVVVVADGSAWVDAAAIDVLVQAEHGPHGLAWLVTWDPEAADAIGDRVAELAAAAPRRVDIEATLAAGGHLALVDGPEQAAAVVNLIAPEHLQVLCDDSRGFIARVRNAGAIFAGPWAPASVGDYVAGPSHVLPTFGSARFSSALTVDDFQKHMHVVTLDEAAFGRVAPWVATLADAEGLDAHAESIRLRQRVAR
jgi:histidinol dehydrogenase